MNHDPQTPGKGGYVRLGFLLAILALLGGTLYYDRSVKIPDNDKRIGQLVDFVNNNFNGLTKEKIRAEAGFAPASTRASGKFEVDHFRYSRTLPFLPSGQNIYVVYENGLVTDITTEAASVSDDALAQAGNRAARKLEPDPNKPVTPNAGGGRASAQVGEPAPAQAPASMPALLPPDPEHLKRQQERKAAAEKNAAGEAGKDPAGGDQPADPGAEEQAEPAGDDPQPESGSDDSGDDTPSAGESDPPPASGDGESGGVGEPEGGKGG